MSDLRFSSKKQKTCFLAPSQKKSADSGQTGLGRRQATLFLTNNVKIKARDLVTNYARPNGIEDALGTSVSFFHQDCLSSEVCLNVDLDTVLKVLANGCYRRLAHQLHGFVLSKPKAAARYGRADLGKSGDNSLVNL